MEKISTIPLLGINFNKSKKLIFLLMCFLFFTLLLSCNSSPKSNKTDFKIAGSIYVGWMPWFLAAEDGTLKDNATKNGINVEFIRGDYIETISQFAAGGVDAVLLTNVDAYSLLHDSGIKSDVILIGSYSNGNDALVSKEKKDLFSFTKTKIGLVENSVSHYLLDRILEKRNLPYRSVNVINISDSEIGAAFASDSNKLNGVVTWNPIVLQLENSFNGYRIADSKEISYEIADMLVVNRKTLEDHPEFATTLFDTWFSIMKRLNNSRRDQTLTKLSALSGGTKEDYIAQLKTTALMVTPKEALKSLKSKSIENTMTHVRKFAIRHKLVKIEENQKIVSFEDEQKKEIHFTTSPLKKYILENANK